MNKHITLHDSHVTYQDRCHQYNQQGLVVWFTGMPGAGKSTLSVEQEKQLFKSGKIICRFKVDTPRYGLNSDLGFTPHDRRESK